MKALVTGGAGFVAGHLRRELESVGYEVVLTDIGDCDLTNCAAVAELVARVRPAAVFHLGAISFVPDAAKDANLLERVNVGGTRNVLEAMVKARIGKRSDGLPTMVFVSTAQVGNEPLSAYAASKLAAEAVVHEYANRVDAVIARPSNHTGPGQSPKFVVPSFVQQAKEIKVGRRDRFSVGNLDSVRDFTDVRDVVRAYRMLLERGTPGKTYLIGSNNRVTMRQLLNLIANAIGVPAVYEVNPEFWRPTDVSREIDVAEIRRLGWEASIELPQTISDMFNSSQI